MIGAVECLDGVIIKRGTGNEETRNEEMRK